jgi:hypothetical protein
MYIDHGPESWTDKDRWGWLVLTLVGIGVIVLIAVVSVGWWWMTRDKRGEYETLEGEDDDS